MSDDERSAEDLRARDRILDAFDLIRMPWFNNCTSEAVFPAEVRVVQVFPVALDAAFRQLMVTANMNNPFASTLGMVECITFTMSVCSSIL